MPSVQVVCEVALQAFFELVERRRCLAGLYTQWSEAYQLVSRRTAHHALIPLFGTWKRACALNSPSSYHMVGERPDEFVDANEL